MVGFHFAECLTNAPLCPHRLKCCEYHLCFHPDRQQIMAQTPKGETINQNERKSLSAEMGLIPRRQAAEGANVQPET